MTALRASMLALSAFGFSCGLTATAMFATGRGGDPHTGFVVLGVAGMALNGPMFVWWWRR